MRIARNSNLTWQKPLAKEFIQKEIFKNQNLRELNSQLCSECASRGLNIPFLEKNGKIKNTYLWKRGEEWYEIVTNKNGNITNLTLLARTLQGEVATIGDYEEKIVHTYSDCGSVVINGLAFPNGYGDGENTIVIRKFKADYVGYICKAEIFNKEDILIIYPTEEVRIQRHDCNPNDYVWRGRVKKIVLLGRKIWLSI